MWVEVQVTCWREKRLLVDGFAEAKGNREVFRIGREDWVEERTKSLSREHLDHTIATGRDDKAAVLAPHDAAHAFATHDAGRRDLLRANAFVERPEADRSVVAGRYGFAAIFADRKGGDGRGVGEHAVCTLAWRIVRVCLLMTLDAKVRTRISVIEPDELILVSANNETF